MCDHNFKIIATRELRQHTASPLEKHDIRWDIRVCFSCGQLEGMGIEGSDPWGPRDIGSVEKMTTTAMWCRVRTLIDSIKGDAQ